MKIYVAGASREKDLCKSYMRRLREAGLEVVSTWPEKMEAQPVLDTALTLADRRKCALGDLKELDDASVLWLITPETQSTGVWVELGYAISQGHYVVVSGGGAFCVFTALADVLEDRYDLTLGGLRDRSHEPVFREIVRRWGPR